MGKTASTKGDSVSSNDKWLPAVSLVVLAVQNSALTLLMRHSRLQPGPAYSPASVVCIVELVKLLLCIGMEMVLVRPSCSFWQHWWQDVSLYPADVWRLAVPALLYAVQNNLGYQALTVLPALTYQVLYQMKILTTALFTVWLLGRSLTWQRWISLVVLMVGVSLVQVSNVSVAQHDQAMAWWGFAYLMVNSITSGFAGVYFELTCKERRRSIWLQSIHLGCWGLLASVVGACCSSQGMSMQGYTRWTWAVILMQSLSGLLVALVIRCSIALSALLSHRDTNPYMIIGTLLVTYSVYLYASGVPRNKEVPSACQPQTGSARLKPTSRLVYEPIQRSKSVANAV